MLREAWTRVVGIPSSIDFSQSVDLFSSINSAARLIGYDMKGPQIRAAHDKIALAATRLSSAPSLLDEIANKNHKAFCSWLYQQLENLRRAADLTLNNYDFSRSNLFPGGWGLVIIALGRGAEDWNKHALLVSDTTLTQKEAPSATAIEISLAQLSFPHFDAPTIVQAQMIPLVTIDERGIKLNQSQAPHVYKIYNAQHVLTTIKPPLFSPRLVYPGK